MSPMSRGIPPSAASAAQEVPNRHPNPIEDIEENGTLRSVSPSPMSADQVKGLNAAHVPKGWMALQSGRFHRVYT